MLQSGRQVHVRGCSSPFSLTPQNSLASVHLKSLVLQPPVSPSAILTHPNASVKFIQKGLKNNPDEDQQSWRTHASQFQNCEPTVIQAMAGTVDLGVQTRPPPSKASCTFDKERTFLSTNGAGTPPKE